MVSKISWRHAILAALVLMAIILVFMQPSIPQNQEYHCFADGRALFGIPNFWNVISNLPFIITGTTGICYLLRLKSLSLGKTIADTGSLIFFCGILLTGFGSVWYHRNPDNDSMVWDRLPMTIAFMAFFSVIIRECVHKYVGKRLLLPFLLLGVLSVAYWQITETYGQGDLRFYFLVQFLPMVLIPPILLLFRTSAYPKLYFWLVLLTYVVAKVFEVLDAEIFHVTGISGHTFKHIMASLTPLLFLVGLRKKHSRPQI